MPCQLGLYNILTVPLYKISPNECPRYGIKPYDGEASVLKLLAVCSTHFITIAPRSTLTLSVTTS